MLDESRPRRVEGRECVERIYLRYARARCNRGEHLRGDIAAAAAPQSLAPTYAVQIERAPTS